MQQVFAVVAVILFGLSSQAQAPQSPALGYQLPACSQQADAIKAYTDALGPVRGANFGKSVSSASSCSKADSAIDDDDTEFDCDAINENCPSLYNSNEERLRRLRDDLKKEAKDAEKELNEELDEQSDLKKEAAQLAKDYAEKEDELNSEIVTAEKDYKEDLREKDKEALQQVQDIQSKISEIANANREIVLKANRAMAELAASKLNARKTCRETARADYQATLKQLDEELAKRGGKVSGGFEGIANAENYRKFLIAKIKNPEPSEQFTLCYSVGDAVETDLQQRNMGGALTMNEFASQIEENNKQRDQLTQQLQQQQQLANQQKIEGYQEHMKAIQALQKKILTNRQNFEKESRAMAEKQRQLESRITKHQNEVRELETRSKNATARYNCFDNKNMFTTGNESADSKLTSAKSYADILCTSPPADCSGMCERYRTDSTGAGGSRGGSTSRVNSSGSGTSY